MRALILYAGAALALTACGGNDAAENTVNLDAGLGAETIAANDTTAIDAATGEAANMAAETNLDLNAADNAATNAVANELRNEE